MNTLTRNFLLLLFVTAGMLLVPSTTRGQHGYKPFFPDTMIDCSIGFYPTMKDYNPYLSGMDTRFFESDLNDTITKNGHKYRVFDQCYYVREDTLSGRMYRYFPELESEFLFCDMSLNEGDTFRFPVIIDEYVATQYDQSWWKYHYQEQNNESVVDSVRWLDGRKVIFLHYLPDSLSSIFSEPSIDNENAYYHSILRFVEGVGPSYGPLGFIEDLPGTNSLALLLCFHHGDSLVYMTHPDLGCEQIAVDMPFLARNEITIYPNPTNDVLYVKREREYYDSSQILITNMSGIVVLAKNLNEKITQLNVSHLSAGIYLLYYADEIGRIVKKFVKQ